MYAFSILLAILMCIVYCTVQHYADPLVLVEGKTYSHSRDNRFNTKGRG